VIDIAGDANGINSQDVGADEVSVATGAGSVASADIVSMWVETAYDKVLVTGGSDVIVRYIPNALVLNVRTVGPAKPTLGPSVVFRLPFRSSPTPNPTCFAFLDLRVTGSAPGAIGGDNAVLTRGDARCSGGTGPGLATFPLSYVGNVMRTVFPFDKSNGMFSAGRTIIGTTRPHVGLLALLEVPTACATKCSLGTLDEARVFPTFTIGSDVPADVNCTQQPDHPDCPELQ
jgi:hypothetical protein